MHQHEGLMGVEAEAEAEWIFDAAAKVVPSHNPAAKSSLPMDQP